jgi:hypothetical protein
MKRHALLVGVAATLALCLWWLRVEAASVRLHQADQPSFQVELHAKQVAALDAGIPLFFQLQSRNARGGSLIEDIRLRYSPLTRRYELRRGREVQSYALLRSALVRLGQIPSDRKVPTTAARLHLDLTRLPAALRLPAQLSRDWQLDSGWLPLGNGVRQ